MTTATATYTEPSEQWVPFSAARSGILAARRHSVNTEREARLSMLSAQIARGEYSVDPHLVADAILRRVFVVAEAQPDQSECSYPASSPSASAKTTPAGPSTMEPTQARPLFVAAPSASLRAVGGTHTHSS